MGLHACGALGDRLVTAAIAAGCDVALVSCCPQKIDAPVRAPLSRAGASLHLRRETLGLANLTARPVGVETSLEATLAAREARHALHLLLRGRGVTLTPGEEMRGINRRRAHAGLAAPALSMRGLPPAGDAELRAFEAEARRRYARVRRLSLPRNMLARLVELAVVLDRAAALEEHGAAVPVLTIFDRAVTPRNVALFASHAPTASPDARDAAVVEVIGGARATLRLDMGDPLTDILQLTRAQSVITGGFAVGGDFAFRFRSHAKIKFYSVDGTCWLRRGTGTDAVELERGDVLLLTSDDSFVLASGLGVPPVEVCPVFESHPGGVTAGAGATCSLLVGVISFDPAFADLLGDALPPFVHVRAAAPESAALRWMLERIEREQRARLPAAGAASAELAQLVLIEALRASAAEGEALRPGWFRAMRDERVGRALRLMHGRPDHEWTLAELARAAAMSRASFAARFKAVAGAAPLAYLTQWRMRLARRALRDGDASVLEIARSLGYASESAFSHAFKRETGLAPRHYRAAAAGAS
ncbi:Transcriptional regulator, AraC family protein [Minicystis rosea]|nr:Transcriptional regulator, AraC family protein [Minicystis rosea]